jgi:hypothetical protein
MNPNVVRHTEAPHGKRPSAYSIAMIRLVGALAAVSLAPSCAVTKKLAGNPDPPAYRPGNSSNVVVKVSLEKQQIYVMEGNRPLLVAATCGGTPDHPTPTGNFRVFLKNPTKRSNTYGFHVFSNGNIVPGKSSQTPSGARYVGYPMPYWVEFQSGYGFHEGYVHPAGRSHGCLRLHKNTAYKFFALVNNGTRVNIARTQPEDATIGRNVPRPTDFLDPDPPGSYLISPSAVAGSSKPVFAN